jgi:hypothetical protein
MTHPEMQIAPTLVAHDRRMQHLRELRVELHLQVKVWGMDATGKPFTVLAETIEISGLGARLTGIHSLTAGEVIGIQYQDQKARFRVMWIGQPGEEKHGQIGVKCLDESKCIWAAALEADSSIAMRAATSPRVAKMETRTLASERRRHQRCQCSGEIELRGASTRTAVTLRVTDISLGGCYAETMSPLPLNTPLELILRVAGVATTLRGIVRTSHTSMGMGIEFIEVAPLQQEQLLHLVTELCSSTAPAKLGTPPGVSAQDTASEKTVDALVRLLQRKGLISEEEFLHEVAKRPVRQRDHKASVEGKNGNETR